MGVNKFQSGIREKLDWGYKLRRMSAELKVRHGTLVPDDAKSFRARLVLCDFRPKWIGLFTEEVFPVGMEIALKIEEPFGYFCLGKVAASALVMRQSKVLSVARFDYRTCIEIVYHTRQELFSIRKYADHLRQGSKLDGLEFLAPIEAA
jgi:hypothetical protein